LDGAPEIAVLAKRKKRWIAVLLVGLPSLFFVWRFYWLRWSADELILARDTTFIKEPLRADGYPDYVAALNAQCRDGVTPENNAAVALLRIVGPASIPLGHRPRFFGMLGIPSLPADGDYFQSWEEFVERTPVTERPMAPHGSEVHPDDYVLDLINQLGRRPWRHGDHPLAAVWLEENGKYLDEAVSSCQQPRFYAPMVDTGKPLPFYETQAPLTNAVRSLARAFCARAMLRAAEKDIAGAWNDTFACRRLGRLVGQGPTLVDGLVGRGVENIAFATECQLLACSTLAPGEWGGIRRRLDELAQPLPLDDRLHIADRFAVLESICSVAQHGIRAVEMDDDGFVGGSIDSAATSADWNIVLRIANQWMDRLVEVARMEDAGARSEARENLVTDIREVGASVKRPAGLFAALVSRKAASQKVGHILVALFCESSTVAIAAESRHETNNKLMRLGLALAEYNSAHGGFPETLDVLVPKYLENVPMDSTTGQPFVYMKEDAGYLLYSFGINGVDDGAKSYDDGGDFDDLAIRIPPQEPTSRPTKPNEHDADSTSDPLD
jgi:hypothetical protein